MVNTMRRTMQNEERNDNVSHLKCISQILGVWYISLHLFGRYTSPMDATGMSLLCNAYWNVCRMLTKTHPLIHSEGVWSTGNLPETQLSLESGPCFGGVFWLKQIEDIHRFQPTDPNLTWWKKSRWKHGVTFEAEITCPEKDWWQSTSYGQPKHLSPASFFVVKRPKPPEISKQAAEGKSHQNLKVGTWKLWKSGAIFRFHDTFLRV